MGWKILHGYIARIFQPTCQHGFIQATQMGPLDQDALLFEAAEKGYVFTPFSHRMGILNHSQAIKFRLVASTIIQQIRWANSE